MRSRLFAEAIGALAKTDTVDARTLAILGESLGPGITPPPSGRVETLQELVHGRDAAVTARTAILNRLGTSKAKRLSPASRRRRRAPRQVVKALPLRVLESFSGHIARSERRLVVTITSGMGSLADNTSGGSIAYRSSKAAVNMVMRSAAIRFGAARHRLCSGQPWMGQDRLGRPQGAVVAAGERDCHATAHRGVRRKSIGKVL